MVPLLTLQVEQKCSLRLLLISHAEATLWSMKYAHGTLFADVKLQLHLTLTYAR